MHTAPPHIVSAQPSDRTGAALASSPQRTCVGCKQIDQQGNLWRAVADAAGRLRFDSKQREAGRGVYVHRRRECLQAAVRGGFSRSLRRKVVVSDVAVPSELGLPGRTSPCETGPAQDFLAVSTPVRVKNQDNHS